jgi:hypothetical protein
MIYNYNKKLIATAQALRKRMTPNAKQKTVLYYNHLTKGSEQNIITQYRNTFHQGELQNER